MMTLEVIWLQVLLVTLFTRKVNCLLTCCNLKLNPGVFPKLHHDVVVEHLPRVHPKCIDFFVISFEVSLRACFPWQRELLRDLFKPAVRRPLTNFSSLFFCLSEEQWLHQSGEWWVIVTGKVKLKIMWWKQPFIENTGGYFAVFI